MLLHHYGEQLAHVYVLVRKGSSKDAHTRFFDKVATSEPFIPLRERPGEAEAIAWLKSKCTILDGDITDPWMGMDETDARALKGQIDVVINCAGLVSFNPSLEVGLNVNTHGVKFLVEACLHWDVPLVHMSTAFVAGNRNGLVFEDEEVVGYFPRRNELDGRDFSLEQELDRRREDRRPPPRAGRRQGAHLDLPREGPRPAQGRRPRLQRREDPAPGRRPRAQALAHHPAGRSRHGARQPLGLAQHVHVHQVARRAGDRRHPRPALRAGAPLGGRERPAVTPSPGGTRASPPRRR